MPRTNEAKWIESRQRWQINVQDDGERKTFISSTPGQKGKIAAEKKADKWFDGKQSKDVRLEKIWIEFLEEIKISTGAANYRQKETMGRLWVLPRLKHARLSRISTQDWQECIYDAGRAGKSKKTCMNIRGTISAFVEFADRKDAQIKRPKKLKLPKDAPVGERHILQPEDIKTLFTHDTILRWGKVTPCHYIHAWRFMVLVGARPGEMAGLEWRDIKDGVMHIQRALNQQGETTKGKTKNARRSQMLTRQALSVLDDQRRMLKQRGIISPNVFPAEDGTPMSTETMWSRWNAYRKQYDILSSPYELRHTMISITKNDLPEPLLKRLVGHGRSMDTMGTYGHAVDGELQAAASIIEGIFDKILDDQVHTKVHTYIKRAPCDAQFISSSTVVPSTRASPSSQRALVGSFTPASQFSSVLSGMGTCRAHSARERLAAIRRDLMRSPVVIVPLSARVRRSSRFPMC